MSEPAIQSWGELYPQAHPEFRVWMGEIILYSEKVEDLLDQ